MRKLKKQSKRLSYFNYIGIVMGFFWLLIGVFGSSFFVGGFGLFLIVLSLTSMGEKDLRKWYFGVLFPSPYIVAHIAPKRGVWIVLLFGILAIAVIETTLIFAPEIIQSWMQNN